MLPSRKRRTPVSRTTLSSVKPATAVKVSPPHESGTPPLAGSPTLASPLSLWGVSSWQVTGDQIAQDVVELMRPVAVPSNPQCKALFPTALLVNEHCFTTAVPGPNDDVTVQIIIFTFRCFFFLIWHKDNPLWGWVAGFARVLYVILSKHEVGWPQRGLVIGWITVCRTTERMKIAEAWLCDPSRRGLALLLAQIIQNFCTMTQLELLSSVRICSNW